MTQKDPLNRDPLTDESGSHPVGTGVGALGGAVAGAAIGSVGGPVGVIAGGAIGAISGAMAGKEIAESQNPTMGGDHEDHIVGEGMGASAGAVVGGAAGSVGGPVGMALGAVVGGIAGGAIGNGADRLINPSPDYGHFNEPPLNYTSQERDAEGHLVKTTVNTVVTDNPDKTKTTVTTTTKETIIPTNDPNTNIIRKDVSTHTLKTRPVMLSRKIDNIDSAIEDAKEKLNDLEEQERLRQLRANSKISEALHTETSQTTIFAEPSKIL
jgi:outer membrane lipoprotein SlyB